MANYNRTIVSSLWSNKTFRRLTPKEKVFYFLLHTGEITSDTSVFPCFIEDCALYCGASKKEIEKMLAHFEELGLVMYDKDCEEIIILDFFFYHPPVGGLTFEMFRKDLAKITSKKIMDALVENSKKYKISIQFFTALKEFVPYLCQDDFNIKKSTLTEEEVKTVAERGRKNASTAKSKEDVLREVEAEVDEVEIEEAKETKVEKNEKENEEADVEELPF